MHVVVERAALRAAGQVVGNRRQTRLSGLARSGVGHARIEPLAQSNIGAGLHTVGLIHRRPILVTHAGRQRDPPAQFPGILEVHFGLFAAELARSRSALRQGRHATARRKVVVVGSDLRDQTEDGGDRVIKLRAAAGCDAGVSRVGRGAYPRCAQDLSGAGQPG